MADVHECPVCAHENARRVPSNHAGIRIDCPACGSFPMFGSFRKGWQAVPADKREEIRQFLRTSREKREALQVELSILDYDTWRMYVQEGQNWIRRAELTKKREGEGNKAA